MTVTQLEEASKTKYKVYIDYEYAFTLSIREMKMYQIKEHAWLSEETYHEMIQELILPKAKLKAMNVLKYMDRTEQELFNKLKLAGFSEVISKEAIAYVKKYNYVNDERYASNFIQTKKSYKSLKMMQVELSNKGLSKEQIQSIVEEEYDSSMEEAAIRREVQKRCKANEELTYEKRMKVSAALYRKGYSADLIRKVMNEQSEQG